MQIVPVLTYEKLENYLPFKTVVIASEEGGIATEDKGRNVKMVICV